jgi:putative transposase
VAGDKSRGVIADSIKLIAGKTGQEFNQRKARKGAYWEDRYHATAIENCDHLIKCIVYRENRFNLKKCNVPISLILGRKRAK